MKFWVILFLAFLVQEPISSGVLLLQAYQHHRDSLWVVHILFVLATLIDIVIGYYIGKYIHQKYTDTRLVSFIRKKLEKFLGFIGKRGKVVGLLLFAPMIFPISTLFIAWLNISLLEAALYMFIGELILWYGSEWLLVLTTKAFVADSRAALYIIFAVFIVISITVKLGIKRFGSTAKFY